MSDLLYELAGIRKIYRLGTTPMVALTDVTMTIEKGRTIALQGPSGSGKSTLLNVLGLIETPSAGSLLFRGEAMAKARERELTKIRRRAVGFIFQNFNLVPVLTALENVEYALFLERRASPTQIRIEAKAALAAVGLSDVAAHKPAQLSGGQRQRVAIARAVVKRPDVILGDEPTANLDTGNARQVMELLTQLNVQYGTTIIVATHDDEMAEFLKDRVHMRDGRIVTRTFAEQVPAAEHVAMGRPQ